MYGSKQGFPFFFIFLFCLFCFVFIPAKCQTQKINFENITSRHGLSVDRVICNFQDSQGLLWIGTTHGLNMYDGYKFTVYQNDPRDPRSLSNNSVWCIKEDAGKNLWIGTSGGGLNKFDKKTCSFTKYQNNPKDQGSISNNSVWALYVDKADNIWIGTENGLNKFDKKSGKFKVYLHNEKDRQSISNNAIWSIIEDNYGFLWIGTSGGLNRFDVKSEKFISYQHNEADVFSVSDNSVWSLYPEKNNVLWVGTSGGLNRFDIKSGRFSSYKNDDKNNAGLSDNKVLSICKDKAGYLWIGTNDGLNILDYNTGKFTVYKNDPQNPVSISDNSVWAIIEDNSGIMWIGTDGGLSKYDRLAVKFISYQHNPENPNSLSENTIWSVYEDRTGILWIGTNDGLNRYDKKTNIYKILKHNEGDEGSISDNSIMSVVEDNDGILWVGTDNGLSALNKTTFKAVNYVYDPDDPGSISSNSVWSLLYDSYNELWVGTTDGLNKINKKTGKFSVFKNNPNDSLSLSNNKVLFLLEDKNNNLWVGTADGLNKFDRKTGKFKVYRNAPGKPASISNNKILSLFEDREGFLWIGTNGGLNKLMKNSGNAESFKSWTKKDGLPDNKICGIMQDSKGRLWISTKKGLSVFNEIGKKNYINFAFNNFDTDDGLPNVEFFANSSCMGKEGNMYFGGINGFISFYPERIKMNDFKPPVVFTGFQLFSKDIEVFNPYLHYNENYQVPFSKWLDKIQSELNSIGSGLIRQGTDVFLHHSLLQTKEITLYYRDNFFTIDFAALHYSKPEKIKFAYKMEGLDEIWNYIGNKHSATFTKLSPGEYTLKVKAANRDGIWNESEGNLKIIILPPFWQTWWFRLLIIILSMLSVYFYIRFRERKLKRDKEILEGLVKIRTVEIQQQKEEITSQRDEIEAQRDQLSGMNEELHHQKKEITLQRDEIQIQKLLVDEKNREVMDSIHYATRIQTSILSDLEILKNDLSDYFVFFRPKDKVSGDFYWCAQVEGHTIITVADCTGHGVPGAFMSMLGISFLREIVVKEYITNPALILKKLRKEIIHALKQKGETGEQKDGMDMALVSISHETLEMQFAGANNPVYFIAKTQPVIAMAQPEAISTTQSDCFVPRNDDCQLIEPVIELVELKGDKMPIAIYERMDLFTNHIIQLQKGDLIYFMSDGYEDQFGGPKNKKFKSKQLKELLMANYQQPMAGQNEIIQKTFDQWKGENHQVDDVTIMGIRV